MFGQQGSGSFTLASGLDIELLIDIRPKGRQAKLPRSERSQHLHLQSATARSSWQRLNDRRASDIAMHATLEGTESKPSPSFSR
jgi:hypothetical protein